MKDRFDLSGIGGPVLVSACLLGISCRYDGTTRRCACITGLHDVHLVPVCPEQLGGLPTPRPSARLAGGDGAAVVRGEAGVVDASGRDVTGAFLHGARQVCLLAGLMGVRLAILKERSPSCATHEVWTTGGLTRGLGVTAAMLRDMGIAVVNEDADE